MIATPCFGLEPDVPTTRAAKRSAVPGRVAAKRRRLPERAKGSRGDRSALLQEKSEQTEVELLQFKSLQFADTSRKALESRKNTVNAALACVSETEYPLTAEALEKLAARFRSAGYRPGFQYLLAAKREHIELGHRWTEQLALKLQDCRRGLERGIGPPQRAAEIRLHVVAWAPEDMEPKSATGPLFPKRAWFVACWWVLREIELANVRMRDVEVHERSVCLTLPVSKTDVKAVGFRRTMRCCCGVARLRDGDVPGELVCPACMASRQVEFRRAMKAQDEAPLFCDSSGMFVKKRAMVQTWKALSGLDEAEGVSGHSARRSGAKALCRCGWELWKIQFHANLRWASDAVKGYTEETFAEVAEQWSLRDGQDSEGMSRSSMNLDSVAEWDQAKEGLAELKKTTSGLARRLGNLERDSKRKRVPWHPVDKNELAREVTVMLDQEARFVQNLGDDGRIHSLVGAEGTVEKWRTKCGWQPPAKGRFRLRLSAGDRPESLCTKCFPSGLPSGQSRAPPEED